MEAYSALCPLLARAALSRGLTVVWECWIRLAPTLTDPPCAWSLPSGIPHDVEDSSIEVPPDALGEHRDTGDVLRNLSNRRPVVIPEGHLPARPCEVHGEGGDRDPSKELQRTPIGALPEAVKNGVDRSGLDIPANKSAAPSRMEQVLDRWYVPQPSRHGVGHDRGGRPRGGGEDRRTILAFEIRPAARMRQARRSLGWRRVAASKTGPRQASTS